MSVVIELLKRHINDHHDDTTTVENLPPLLHMVVSNIDKFHSYLTFSKQSTEETKESDVKLLLPVGAVEPLGFHRLKVIEFFAVLVRTNYKCIDTAIVKTGVLATCLVSRDSFCDHAHLYM